MTADPIVEKSLGADLRRLYRHLSPRRRRQLVFVLAMLLAGALAELATIGSILPFLALLADPGRIDAYPWLKEGAAALGFGNAGDLIWLAALLLGTIAIGACVVRLVLGWVSQRFVYGVGHDLATEVYRRTLYQPYSYHLSRNTSETIGTIQKAQVVTGVVLMSLMNAVTGAVIAGFILVALLAVDARMTVIAAACFGFIYVAIASFTRGRLKSNSAVIAAAHTARVQAAQEGLGGIRDVLLDRAQPVYVAKFARADVTHLEAQTVNGFISRAPRLVLEAVGMVLIAVLALVFSRSAGGLTAALPALGALALGAQRLLPLIQQLYFGWSQALGNRRLLTDVLGYLDLPAEESASGPADPLPFERAITLEGVTFRYGPGQATVLDGIDLTIRKGERVALVGKTGSGKSTLMDLLMALLQPTGGRILVDGVPVTDATKHRWRANIAHVPQAIYLSDASIADNIAFAVEPGAIDMARVKEAARRAQIADFIDGLPQGYATSVGERGVRLSGGQRQRVGIARALYRRASVLVLDEATSALDNETEAAVMDAIRHLDRDLTILLVAHRLTTVEMCDRVLEMSGGRVKAPSMTTIPQRLRQDRQLPQ